MENVMLEMNELLKPYEKEIEYLVDNTKVASGNIKWLDGRRNFNITEVNLLLNNQFGVEVKLLPNALYEEFRQYRMALEPLFLALEQERRNAVAGGAYRDVRKFVSDRLERMGVYLDSTGILKWNDESLGKNTSAEYTQVLRKLRCELAYYNDNERPVDPNTGSVIGPLLKEGLIPDSIDLYINKVLADRLAEVRNNLRYSKELAEEYGNDITPWITKLFTLYGVETSPENILMFQQFLFQIKCGVMGRNYRGARIFFGLYSAGQLVGKTQFFANLSKHFTNLYVPNGKLSDLMGNNPNDLKALIRGKALIDFQELGIDSAFTKWDGTTEDSVLATLKGNMTSFVVEGRKMYSSENEKLEQNACFGTSTNVHVYDVLYDPTGMRRYWEFDICLRQEDMTAERWAQIDPLWAMLPDIYRCIDENKEKGYYYVGCEHYEGIKAKQESYKQMDLFSKYLMEKSLELHNNELDGADKITLTKFRQKLNDWLSSREDKTWDTRKLEYRLSTEDIMPLYETAPSGVKVAYLFVKKLVVPNEQA